MISIFYLKVKENEDKNQQNIGREYYAVTFFYDRKKEVLAMPFTARVLIWADTGKVFSAHFGNGDNLYNLDTQTLDVRIPYMSLPPTY